MRVRSAPSFPSSSQSMVGRRIFFLAIAGALASVSLLLLSCLGENSGHLSTFAHVRLGLILLLSVTSVAAYPGFVLPLWKSLPEAYYRVHDRARAERLARWLGVSVFRAVLMAAFWGHAGNRAQFFDGTRSGLEGLDVRTRRAEFGHLLAGLLVTLVATWLALHGYALMAGVLLSGNVLMNAYPIVLQRWHRARLTSLLRRSTLSRR